MTIKLIPFQPIHFQQLLDAVTSADFLMQWAGPSFDYPLTIEQLETYRTTAEEPNASARIYTAVDKKSGSPVGHIALGSIDLKNRSARIGKVLIHERWRGRGAAEIMINETLDTAFQELRLHRVSLGVFDFNTPAIAVYEKAGFQKEGLLRDIRKTGDSYWSLWEMSILEEEWIKWENKSK
ncbi:RimJ/RimL family protein N-acetyltransferase [Sinobaca qinghaiensis]|uniref:RimJ/RimL family protein N-acetyltransferase n=1 Tax=Sinobaca qinghaiensis TaxID=342944 RepID=A0A419UX68_9BACL|nr:GNAT family protein [Sinobaca qinghaiensis]RKD69711.1 RimJ/RimL family protein N-acetyltransferase [Sinobaca qinghaiensis]